MISVSLLQLSEMCQGELVNTQETFKVTGVTINTRKYAGEDIFIPIIGENFDGHHYVKNAFEQGAKVALFQKDHNYEDISYPLILVDDTRLALGRLAKAYRHEIGANSISITGSNGKTSAKDILFHLMNPYFEVSATSGNRNNDIGLPLTILESDADTNLFILEMGMSALGEIEYLQEIVESRIVLITSIGAAHLNDLGSMDNIIKAKLEITAHMPKDGVVIVNGDHERFMEILKTYDLSQKVITYGFGSNNDYVITDLSQFQDSLVFRCEQLSHEAIVTPLLGRHQALNTLGALLAGRELNIPVDTLLSQLEHVRITGHRNELIRVNQALLIDDSYKSNPEALLESLLLLSQFQGGSRKIAVLGDMLDLGDKEVEFHQQISKEIDEMDIDRVYTIGRLANHFHDFHHKIAHHFENQDDLVEALRPWLKQPAIILFKGANALALFDVVDKLKSEEKKMKKVALIFGGKSSEYAVSLSSIASVIRNFPIEDYEYILVGMSKEGRFFMGDYSVEEIENDEWLPNPSSREVLIRPGANSSFTIIDNLEDVYVDACFNMIHGKVGEDGVLQSLMSSGNLSLTGCDQQSSILAYDKDITHRLLDNEGILKAKYRTLTRELSEEEYHDLVDFLGEKVILKPAREGSSYGISVATDFESFRLGLKEALTFDNKVVVEEFIKGFEVGASVLEKDGQLLVGDVDEIELQTDFFDYEGKYSFKNAAIVCPARLNEKAERQVKESAKLVFKLLGCRDFSRVDFFYGEDGRVYFNEINTIPGFTSHSRYPSMMKGIGIDYKEIIVTLIENALKRRHG
ncbi:MAG: UDP-N-acetylmuramoyl-tripeptide--D-alanyl-D-alanine ligase [Erysipelothrix sp.]|nr:UDP-N-acetylmuramoyl-tripeptide--D-alanyl-D-alanine ligase [Erysipelothrix sp.]